MIEKSDFVGSFTKEMLERANEFSFTYHENTFDWPQLHTHADYWEFTVLIEGTVNNYLNDETATVRKNTLFFSTTKDTHALRKAPNSGKLHYINIMVRESYLIELMEHIKPSFSKNILKGGQYYALPPAMVASIEDIVHKVNLLKSRQYHTYNNLLCSAILSILQFIFLQSIDVFENNPVWLDKLSALMLNKQFLTYTVADLCKELNYSNAHLTRLFRNYFNTSPNEYLLEWKFRYARNLLKHSDMTILDIAMQIGYSNLSQFNIQFKKRFHVTPGEYRKANKPTKKKLNILPSDFD